MTNAERATVIEQTAQRLWDRMNKSERHGVGFGLFPAAKLRDVPAHDQQKVTRALMNIAERNGGMIG